jgi:mannose-6-phosphate isomerase-like protein (cupin superfamily)
MTTNVVSRATAEHYNWGGDCDGWHLVRHAALSVIHERMPKDRVEVRHSHARARQFFFVLTGELTIEADGVIHAVPAGHGLELPPSVPHQAMNRSNGDVEFLVISHPPAQGDRVLAP